MQSVNELCEKGNSLSEVGMYQEALSCFKHALEKTPETYDYEDERVWILVAIGDTLFQLQQYSNAMEYLRRAYFYDPGNPFINLRLGQCELESDCILDAKEHLHNKKFQRSTGSHNSSYKYRYSSQLSRCWLIQ